MVYLKSIRFHFFSYIRDLICVLNALACQSDLYFMFSYIHVVIFLTGAILINMMFDKITFTTNWYR